MRYIFEAILDAKLVDFKDEFWLLEDSLLMVYIGIQKEIVTMFLLMPTKSHYVFNMQDLAKNSSNFDT